MGKGELILEDGLCTEKHEWIKRVGEKSIVRIFEG